MATYKWNPTREQRTSLMFSLNHGGSITVEFPDLGDLGIGEEEYLSALHREAAAELDRDEAIAERDDLMLQLNYSQAEVMRLRGEGWIPVGLRLPDMDEDVLVLDERKEVWIGDWSVVYGSTGWSDDECRDIDATHWRPLPEPPEGE